MSAWVGAFLAVVAGPRQDDHEPVEARVKPLEAEVRRLMKKNARLIRSRLLMMEHIEVLNDELRHARRRIDEERETNRRLLEAHARAAAHYEQQATVQRQQAYIDQLAVLDRQTALFNRQQQQIVAQNPSQAQLQALNRQAQNASPQAWGDCTCVPGRSAA